MKVSYIVGQPLPGFPSTHVGLIGAIDDVPMTIFGADKPHYVEPGVFEFDSQIVTVGKPLPGASYTEVVSCEYDKTTKAYAFLLTFPKCTSRLMMEVDTAGQHN